VERRVERMQGKALEWPGWPTGQLETHTGVIGFDSGRRCRRSEPWSPEPR